MERRQNYWQTLRAKRLTRRRLLAGTTAGLAVAAAACSSNTRGQPGQSGTGKSQSSPVTVAPAPSGQPIPGGILTTSNRDNSPTLDLHRTTSGYSKGPEGAILSRLLRYQSGLDLKVGAGHKVEADLATSWESPDATT